jgi:hypothetical protein
MGLTGGVKADQITKDTFRIVSRGNGYTSGTTIQDYALLKAAETTKQAGGSHFIVTNAADASRSEAFATPGTVQTTVTGNTAVSTYSPGSISTFIKPGQDTYIRVLRLPSGQQPPPGAYFAEEIIQFVGSRVQRPN